MGVGRETAGREHRARQPQQRLQRKRRPGRHAGVRARPTASTWQNSASMTVARHLVRQHRRSNSCWPRSATRTPASGHRRSAIAKARERSVRSTTSRSWPRCHGGDPTIKDNPPLIYHPPGEARRGLAEARQGRPLPTIARRCRRTGACSSTAIEFKDVAIKVVGVGSVGTLLRRHAADGERGRSPVPPGQGGAALGPGTYAGTSAYANHGQRVVQRQPAHAGGQRHLPRLDRRASSAATSTSASCGT